MLPLDIAPPPYYQPLPPVGIVRYAEPSWDRLARYLNGLTFVSYNATRPGTAPQTIPQAQLPVEVDLIEEGIDERRGWFQRFEVAIGPGGTIADAAIAVYGDERRAADLLDIVKQRSPNIDVRRIPVGLRIGITVDPTVAFVLKDSRREGDWEIRSYFNGAIEKRRVNARVVTLPVNRPGKEYAVPGDTSDRPVPAGARLMEYQYRANENFELVIGLLYPTPSVSAMSHFIQQTGYDVNNWPPPALDKLRVVVSDGAELLDHPLKEMDRPFPGQRPVEIEALLKEQQDGRRQAGIFTVARDAYRTTYRLRVASPRLSARQVALLIYNDPERWKEVAESASIELPQEDPPPDVRLQGRDFELPVLYEDEGFPVSDPVIDNSLGTKTSRLLNGTQTLSALKGPSRVIALPTGYRKVVHQPVDIMLVIARLYAGSQGVGDEGIARFLWDWDPSTPRQPGDSVETAALVVRKQQTTIEVTVQARAKVVDTVAVLRQWAPFGFAALAITIGIVLIILAGRSRSPKPYRRRWD